jgi:hypothetical protein
MTRPPVESGDAFGTGREGLSGKTASGGVKYASDRVRVHGPEIQTMVPQNQAEIGLATAHAVQRLLARLSRDRESLLRDGCGGPRDDQIRAAAGLERLNALIQRADDVREVLQGPDPRDQ